MPITRQEFIRQAEKRLIQGARVEDRLEGLNPEERLQCIRQLLQEATPEDREKFRKLFEDTPPARSSGSHRKG